MSEPKPTDGKLTAREARVAALTVAGKTRPEIATELKISVATVGRALAEQRVKNWIYETQNQVMYAVVCELTEAAHGAVRELRRLSTEATSKHGPRVAACRSLLQFLFISVEAEDLKLQLEQLKALLKERDSGPRNPFLENAIAEPTGPAMPYATRGAPPSDTAVPPIPEPGADFAAALGTDRQP